MILPKTSISETSEFPIMMEVLFSGGLLKGAYIDSGKSSPLMSLLNYSGVMSFCCFN